MMPEFRVSSILPLAVSPGPFDRWSISGVPIRSGPMWLRKRSFTLGMVLAWAWAGAPARAGEPLRWDVPRVIASVPVSGEMSALGVPLRVSAVRSEERVEALFDHFLALFKRAELFIPPRGGQFQIPGGLQLTGLDPIRRISYTVIFQPNPDGTTTVILGEADLYRRQDPGAPRDVPIFPGGSDVLTVDAEGGGKTVTYRVRAAPAEVSAFYREVLKKAGYAEGEDGTFARRGEEIRVLAQSGHEAGSLFVFVMKTSPTQLPPAQPQEPRSP